MNCCPAVSRHAFIEPLEDRITPAALVTLIDSDGDSYTIKLTGPGTFVATQTNPGSDSSLASLALADTTAKSALSIAVKKSATGDGKVSVGSISGPLLGSLMAPAANLDSALTFAGGIASIRLGDIADGAMLTVGGDATKTTKVTLGVVGDHFVLQSSAKLGVVSAARLGDGLIMAPALASLTAKTGGILADLKITGAVGRISAAGATGGSWMAESFGTVAGKAGDFDADLIATGPLAKKATLSAVSVTGGDFTGSLSAVGGIGKLAVKASKGVGGSIADPDGRVVIAGASLARLTATGQIDADIEVAGAAKFISARGDAAGEWDASLFGTIKISDGRLSATIDATAQQMPVGRTPAIARIAITGGSLQGTITADGAIAAISVLAKRGTGGSIAGAQIIADTIGSVSALSLRDSSILAGSDSIAGPFGAATISRLSFRTVENSTIGAGLASDDLVLKNGDDRLVAGSAVKSFTISGTADAGSFFASAAFPATVKIGKARVTPAADARFFTTGTADGLAPLLSAALAFDTGILPDDGITSNPQIEGRVRDASAIASFVGGLDDTLPADFTSVLGALRANGAFTLDRAALETLNGGPLADGPHTLHLRATDAAGNVTGVFDLGFTLTGFQLFAHAPVVGSGEVGVTFQPQVYFSEPVNPATLSANNFFASFGGAKLDATIVPANDGSFAWLFFDDPLPNSSQIQVTVDGSTILAADDAAALDAAGTGVAGSTLEFSFSTVSITPVAGTSLVGRIVDPGPDKLPMTPDDYDDGPDGIMHTGDDVFTLPIEGVKVFIIGLENKTVFTDAQGFFRIDDIPAGDVKIVTDGMTAVNPPAGFYFPEMVMDARMAVGQDNAIMPGMSDMYLPRLASAILQNVSAASGMMITADAEGAPDLTPAQRAMLTIDVPASSLLDASGQALGSGMVGVSTVPGSLVRDMLPAGILQHSFDITVQAPGIAKFSTPAPMTVPNVLNAEPGSKLNFLSFDHTTGRLVIEGTGTVSADGTMITTDPGYGITHPGWHSFTPPGSDTGGPDGAPPPPPPKPCMDANDAAQDVLDFAKLVANCVAGLTGVKGAIDAAISLVADANKLRNDLASLQSAQGDLATFKAGYALANDLKQSIANTVDKLSDSGPSPVNKAREIAKCAQDLLALAKNVCDQYANGPCGTPELKLVCIGLGVVEQTVADANALIALAEKAQDGLKGIGVAALCATMNSIAGKLGLVPTPAPHETRGTDPVPQAIIDQLATAISQADTVAADAVTLDEFSQTLIAMQDGAATTLDDAVTFYNQTHDAAKNAYWMFDYDNFQLRGQANEFGKVNAFLPPKTEFTLTVYDQNSNRLATYHGMTNEAGTPTSLPQFAFLSTDGLPDRDGDGLVDAAEMTIGTDPLKGDSNDDGLSDFASVQNGLDPLAGAAFPTGVVASLPVAGEALDVALTGNSDGAGQTAYVAAGTGGLAIVDASKLSVPVLLSQLPLPGNSSDVAVDPSIDTAVVAGNAGGVSFIDVSDALNPAVRATINVNASQVGAFDGIAYVAVGTKLNAYDPLNGSLIDSVNIGSSSITDIARDGDTLLVMDSARVLTSVDIANGNLAVLDTLAMPDGGGKLAVAGGVAHATAANAFNGGFATADVSDPANLTLISGSDLPGAQSLSKNGIAVNGSGIALLVGQSLGQNVVEVMNVSDPANTAALVTNFSGLPAAPLDVAIGSGIGFLAMGASGLQVVNYRAFDTTGVAPVVTLASDAADLDAGTPGVQRIEGSSVRLRVSANDDVQVRAVELLLNGQVVASDVSAPFDFAATLPALADATTATLQVRATDTGGNSTISNSLVFNLTEDTFAPTVVAKSPDPAGFSVRSITLRFDEAIDSTLPTLDQFTLVNFGADGVAGGGDDTTVPLASVNLPTAKRLVLATDGPLPFGNFQLTVDPDAIADLAGNHPAAAIVHAFTSYDADPNSKVWISDASGNWGDSANWLGGAVPTASDPVFIKRLGANPTITVNGDFAVKNIVSDEAITISNFNRLSVTGGDSFLDGALTLGVGGTLRATGVSTSLEVNGVAGIASGNVSAESGAFIELHSLGSLAVNSNTAIGATGTGSRILLGDLTTLPGGTGGAALFVDAFTNGRIDFPSLTSIPSGTVRFNAEGGTAMIDLPLITSLIDNAPGTSLLQARSGGNLNIPLLTTIENAEFVLDGATSQIDSAQISDIAKIDPYARNGASLSFPGVTTITGNLNRNSVIEANAGGAVLSFPNVTTLTGANNANFFIDALNGASVLFPALTSIPDGAVRFDAHGTGGLIDLPLLTTFTDNLPGTSQLKARNGGNLNIPLLTTIENAEFVLDGATSQIDSAQISNINKIDIYSYNGANLSFPSVTSITGNLNRNNVLEANAGGAVLSFPNVTTLTGANNANLFIDAYTSGSVLFPLVTSIPDGVVRFDAHGTDSLIDLPLLTTFTDNLPGTSQLKARNGGNLNIPLLTTIENAEFVLDGATSQIDSAQISNINKIDIYSYNGANLSFPSVTTITGNLNRNSVLEANAGGAVLSFPNVTTLTGANNANFFIDAYTSGSVLFPLVTSIPDGVVRFDAAGTGSLIDLPLLTTFTDNLPGTSQLQARSGGNLNIPLLTTIENAEFVLDGATSQIDSAQISNINKLDIYSRNGANLSFPSVTSITGNLNRNNVLEANAGGAVLSFPNVTTLTGANNANLFVDAYTSGSVLFPLVTSIPDGVVRFDAAGTDSLIDLPLLTTFIDNLPGSSLLQARSGGNLNIPLLTTIENAEFVLDGATSQIDSAQISNINKIDIYSRNGANLSFPGVTSITGNLNRNNVLEANAGGAVLSFPNVTTLTGANNANLFIDAYGGADVLFPALTSIPDGVVRFDVSGTGSLFDAPLLTTFIDNQPGTSQIQVRAGGEMNIPLLTDIQNAELVLNGATSQIDTAQFTNIDKMNAYARGGAILSFPNVTTITGNTFNTVLEASDAGSQLILPSLTTLHGATAGALVLVNSYAGTTVSMPALTSIPDGAVRFDANGASAVISLPALTSFTDNATGTSVLYARNGGALQLTPGTLTVSAVDVEVNGSYTVGTLELGAGAFLYGTGTINGNLLNTAGTVSPGNSGPAVLTVTGNFTQAAGGTLTMGISGTTPGTGYDRLAVGGFASLAGTLALSTNVINPALGATFTILTASSVSGTFGTVIGTALTGKQYSVGYNTADVTLTVVP